MNQGNQKLPKDLSLEGGKNEYTEYKTRREVPVKKEKGHDQILGGRCLRGNELAEER